VSRAYGPYHLTVATRLNNLALVLKALGDLTAACKGFRWPCASWRPTSLLGTLSCETRQVWEFSPNATVSAVLS